ncbi:hypothetical protein LXA43DRAFT_723011 [Ganoderma leucocontextum]|nr:hypothetical protein LXA43DRAFT_723011 [Ganoderma leucocontextum]
MRGASIPAWTFLREPSASSGAPSEDELLGHSSQEVVDELVHLPPLQSATSSRRMGPPPVPGPSSARNHGGGRQSGNYGTQPSSSASRRPTSPSRTRRPHSGTDDDDERPKKRKRDLLNPDKDGPHQSQTVQLSDSQRYTKGTHQRLLFNAPLSNATASRSGQHRRATVAGPFESKNAQPNAGPLNHKGVDKQGRAGGSASSVGRHPAPLSQAQTRNARPSTQVASAKGEIHTVYASCNVVDLKFRVCCRSISSKPQAASCKTRCVQKFHSTDKQSAAQVGDFAR